MGTMEKSSTLNLRVNPDTKRQAEEVLSKLGIPMSTAIDIYLNQIILTGGLPFPVMLPDAPLRINADLMSAKEIHLHLQEGIRDAEEGKLFNVSEAFENFRKDHQKGENF